MVPCFAQRKGFIVLPVARSNKLSSASPVGWWWGNFQEEKKLLADWMVCLFPCCMFLLGGQGDKELYSVW
jgi:hypothetical protein